MFKHTVYRHWKNLMKHPVTYEVKLVSNTPLSPLVVEMRASQVHSLNTWPDQALNSAPINFT